MLPTLQVGPLSLQVPGLVILIGLWIGLTLSERRARQHGENPAAIYNLVFIVLIAGLVGARLAYALTYSEAFLTNPWSLVSINTGLLDPFAGALIAITAGTIYLMRKQMDIWKMLDAITPLMAVMGIAVGISHLASGTAFGRPTDLPIGIHFWGELRHPTQVYEIIMAALTLGAVFLALAIGAFSFAVYAVSDGLEVLRGNVKKAEDRSERLEKRLEELNTEHKRDLKKGLAALIEESDRMFNEQVE